MVWNTFAALLLAAGFLAGRTLVRRERVPALTMWVILVVPTFWALPYVIPFGPVMLLAWCARRPATARS